MLKLNLKARLIPVIWLLYNVAEVAKCRAIASPVYIFVLFKCFFDCKWGSYIYSVLMFVSLIALSY